MATRRARAGSTAKLGRCLVLLRAYLYNLAPGKTEDELIAFDHRVTERFTSYCAEHGRRYLGVFKVAGLPDYAYAEFTLVDADSVQEAQAQRAALVIPDNISDIFAECDTYIAPETRDLWLRPLALSALAAEITLVPRHDVEGQVT
jgi:hypothetical protein